MIDELDRCRPDYALSLLEIVKHFFNVSGVHFVLGVNLSELQNSVRVRYGSNVDAATYLQKFYSVVLRLPRRIQYTQTYLLYYLHASGQMQIPVPIHKTAHALLERYNGTTPMTPRTIQRILTVLALIPHKRPQHISNEFLVTAAITKVCAPHIYEAMRLNELKTQDLRQVFNLDQNDLEPWHLVSRAAAGGDEVFESTTRLIPENLLQEICEEYLEIFDSSALQSG